VSSTGPVSPAAAESAPDRPAGLPPRRSRGWLLLALAVVAVLLLVAVVVVLPRRQGPDGNPAQGEAVPRGLSGVRVSTFDSTAHREGDITYGQHPPAGGEHSSAWWDCGTFTAPVRDENAVHSLEHGTVWVTYVPGTLDAEETAALEALLPDRHIISPYPGQDPPLVVTVWGRQLALEGPDDPRLESFVNFYGDGHTAPEPFASCVGGVRTAPGSSADA
jgi:hypothetical protein